MNHFLECLLGRSQAERCWVTVRGYQLLASATNDSEFISVCLHVSISMALLLYKCT